MNVSGIRIKEEVLEGAREFMRRRQSFNTGQVEAELIRLLIAHGQPGSLAISMADRFVRAERDAGHVEIARARKFRNSGYLYRMTPAGLNLGAKKEDA